MDEVDELAARIEKLPDDAQWTLAWRILKRFGLVTPEEQAAARAALEAEMRAEIDTILALEKANGLRPGGGYRAAG